MKVVRSACPLDCWDGCTFLVETDGRELLSVKGDPANPYTAGFVCPKARFLLERAQSPSRPMRPMIKVGTRWQEASWDEALGYVAEAIAVAFSKYGSQALFYYHDSGSMGLLKNLGLRLMRRLGPITEPSGSLCWAAGIKAQEYDFGYHLANDPADIVNSRYVVVWGRNPAETNVHLLPLLKKARTRGAKVILVDPVKTSTAKFSDYHVKVRPAGDAALAFAVARLILERRREDVGFIAANSVGFGEFAGNLGKFDVSQYAQMAGVDLGDVELLAGAFMDRPCSVLMGYGMQRYRTGGNSVRAVDALVALSGNIGLPGGGANYANGWISSRLEKIAVAPAPGTRWLPKALLAQLREISDPPVQVMIVTCSNPVAQAPDSKRVGESMSQIPVKITLDLRLSETALESDVFLPVASSFEEEDLYFCSWHPYVTYAQKVVDPPGQCMSEAEIWSRLAMMLASRLGRDDLSREFSVGPSQWIARALSPLKQYGMEAEELRGETFKFPGISDVAWADGRFWTPSGRFEFFSRKAADDGVHPMAYSGGFWSDGGQGVPGSRTIRLITSRTIVHLHSQFWENVTDGTGIAPVYLHPSFMSRVGIEEGDTVELRRPGCAGGPKLICRAVATEDVGRDYGVTPEGGNPLRSRGVNALTDAQLTDIGEGAPFNECMVEVVKAERGT